MSKSIIDLNSIKINKLKIIEKSPTRSLRFHSSLKIRIRTNNVDSKSLKSLNSLKLQPIAVYEKSGKRSVKIVTSVKYSKKSINEFLLFIEVDGGFPIKRFVVGDDVSPNLSNILNETCFCEQFDVLGVEIK